MFKVLQKLSLAGGEKNIDLIRASKNCILLLDGSTPLIESNYDASLFVKDFSNALFCKIESGFKMPQAIDLALNDVYELFKEKTANDDFDMYPSACLCVAYLSKGNINIINVGDSVALVVMRDKTIKAITCDDVSRFDDLVLSKAKEIKESANMDMCDVLKLPEIKQMLINNRKMMNAPDGYKILTFGMPSIEDEEIHTFDSSEVERIILYTDGFDACSDMLMTEDANIDDIYRALRSKENADVKLNDNPRFKVSDDASAIIFTIEK